MTFSQFLPAHALGPLQPDDLAGAWELEPGVVLLLAIPALLYLFGRRDADRRRSAYFWGGLAVLAFALISPLHPLGEVLFSAHMAQHEVLMLIAAPLLVLSRPSVPLLRGLPFAARRVAGRGRACPANSRASGCGHSLRVVSPVHDVKSGRTSGSTA